jgi:hypothetical protein
MRLYDSQAPGGHEGSRLVSMAVMAMLENTYNTGNNRAQGIDKRTRKKKLLLQWRGGAAGSQTGGGGRGR